jgi:hypothetical protein
MPIRDPSLLSPEFPCTTSTCAGFKVQFDANKCREQEAIMLDLLSDTQNSLRVIIEGESYTNIEQALKGKGIDMKTDMWKLPGAKLQKWNLYTEDKLKEMTANGDSYNVIKAVRYSCFLL